MTAVRRVAVIDISLKIILQELVAVKLIYLLIAEKADTLLLVVSVSTINKEK